MEVRKAVAGMCSAALAPLSPELSGRSVWRAPSTGQESGMLACDLADL